MMMTVIMVMNKMGSSERKLPLSSAILWPGVCGALKTSFSGLSLKVSMTMMMIDDGDHDGDDDDDGAQVKVARGPGVRCLKTSFSGTAAAAAAVISGFPSAQCAVVRPESKSAKRI